MDSVERQILNALKEVESIRTGKLPKKSARDMVNRVREELENEMDFLEKIGLKNNELDFLQNYEFEENESCGYGCCKGWYRGFHSSNGLYYNRLIVFIRDEKIWAVNHNEYDVGGYCWNKKEFIDRRDCTEELVLKMINSVLPDDLEKEV